MTSSLLPFSLLTPVSILLNNIIRTHRHHHIFHSPPAVYKSMYHLHVFSILEKSEKTNKQTKPLQFNFLNFIWANIFLSFRKCSSLSLFKFQDGNSRIYYYYYYFLFNNICWKESKQEAPTSKEYYS